MRTTRPGQKSSFNIQGDIVSDAIIYLHLERIVQAPGPSRPIERGIAGPGLLAHVLVAKFAVHLPLYRQPRPRLQSRAMDAS